VGFIKIKDVFPLWAVVAIVGTILAFAMLILTEHHTKPRYHSVVEKKPSLLCFCYSIDL
jgi:hypothetical protein